MTSFPSPTQCPPPPPSSPTVVISGTTTDNNNHHSSHHHHHQQQHDDAHLQQPPLIPQQQIANLLQYAQTSYTTNPTDALSALMDALTLTTGTNNAAQHAMDRIRTELGDAVADCVIAGNGNASIHQQQQQQQPMHHTFASQQQQQYTPNNSSESSTSSMAGHHQLSEREMTLKAMELVKELLNDTSTILYAQGRQHLLQQAMEDGSSVVCSKCGDMISRERWMQHAEYWCRGITVEEEKNCGGGGDGGLVGMEDVAWRSD
ncbi:hypothetical protein ACHAXR_009786 [Thalassiosira sp. AJA248-18]